MFKSVVQYAFQSGSAWTRWRAYSAPGPNWIKGGPKKEKEDKEVGEGNKWGEENQSPGYCIHRIQNLCTHDLALLTFDVFNF